MSLIFANRNVGHVWEPASKCKMNWAEIAWLVYACIDKYVLKDSIKNKNLGSNFTNIARHFTLPYFFITKICPADSANSALPYQSYESVWNFKLLSTSSDSMNLSYTTINILCDLTQVLRCWHIWALWLSMKKLSENCD